MDRDFAVFNLNEMGLRRFAFPFQTPKIQRTRRETDFSPKNIDAHPQKVKDGVAPLFRQKVAGSSGSGSSLPFRDRKELPNLH